jgi:molecular chaperone GrpE
MSRSDTAPSAGEPERVVIRDKRKIDPATGEARAEAKQADAAASEPLVEAALLDERTADLQRLQAEYANYRKRADRDRLAAGEVATARAIAELLPVLDDIDRARAHGDVSGPVETIVDKLEQILAKLGLESFGAEGDEFDPKIHEAVLHTESDDVTVPTCTTIMRRGYRYALAPQASLGTGDRLLRAAMVGVTDPTHPPARQSQPEPPDTAPAADASDTESTAPAADALDDTQPANEN